MHCKEHNELEHQCRECGQCVVCGCDCVRVNLKPGDKAILLTTIIEVTSTSITVQFPDKSTHIVDTFDYQTLRV